MFCGIEFHVRGFFAKLKIHSPIVRKLIVRQSFRFYASAAYAATDALCFCLVRPVFRPVRNIYPSIRKNTARISIKFAGSNQYHE